MTPEDRLKIIHANLESLRRYIVANKITWGENPFDSVFPRILTNIDVMEFFSDSENFKKEEKILSKIL